MSYWRMPAHLVSKQRSGEASSPVAEKVLITFIWFPNIVPAGQAGR